MEQNKQVTQSNPGIGFVEKMITAVESFEKAKELGQFIINSGFAPKHFEGKPEAVVLAIDAGRKLGFDWFQALQEGFIVNGIPGYKARALKALVMASGLCEMWETTFSGSIEKEDRSITIRFKRKGSPEQERMFNVSMAKRAGLWGKKKKYDSKNSKWIEYDDAWCKHPDDMMEWKCVSRVLNEFPDVCKGFKSVEELADIAVVEEQEAVVVTANGLSLNPATPTETSSRTSEVLGKVESKMPKVETAKTRPLAKEKEPAKPEPSESETYLSKLNQMTPVEVSEELKAKLPFDPQKLFDKGVKKSVKLAKELLIAVSENRLREYVINNLAGTGLDLLEYKEEPEVINPDSATDDDATIELLPSTETPEISQPPRSTMQAVEVAEMFDSKGIDAKTIASNEGFTSDEDLFRHASVEVINKYLEANS